MPQMTQKSSQPMKMGNLFLKLLSSCIQEFFSLEDL